MSTTKVITGKVRFSYVNIFKSRAFQAGQDAKYSVCLLIPKEDKATIKKIKAAIDAAVQDGISSKWGGKKPANLKQPLRDGDAERADEAPEYEGMYFLNCNSTQKPGIVDKDLNEILDPDEVYSGCWGRASINFFPFNTNGNKGVGVGAMGGAGILERFGGRMRTAEAVHSDLNEKLGGLRRLVEHLTDYRFLRDFHFSILLYKSDKSYREFHILTQIYYTPYSASCQREALDFGITKK